MNQDHFPTLARLSMLTEKIGKLQRVERVASSAVLTCALENIKREILSCLTELMKERPA